MSNAVRCPHCGAFSVLASLGRKPEAKDGKHHCAKCKKPLQWE